MTIGEYNFLDMSLIKTRSPVRSKNGNVYFPGKMCFFVDHILGPVYDRKLNEIFLAVSFKGKMGKVCKTVHKAMVSAGATVKDMISLSRDDKMLFDGLKMKDCIDKLYAKHVGNERSIELFTGNFKGSQ